jgi:hypothetical protein
MTMFMFFMVIVCFIAPSGQMQAPDPVYLDATGQPPAAVVSTGAIQPAPAPTVPVITDPIGLNVATKTLEELLWCIVLGYCPDEKPLFQ